MSAEGAAMVRQWSNDEIAPWKAIILGGWDARRFDTMAENEQWMYIKYRYDVHMYYQGIPPPPTEMWREGLFDVMSPNAQNRFHQRVLCEMYEEMSTDSARMR